MVHASHIHQSWSVPSYRRTATTQSPVQGLPSQAWHLTVAIDWVSINTRLISHNSQDLRVSARGLPVHMERSPLGTERFWGLALQLAGFAMIVRGLE